MFIFTAQRYASARISYCLYWPVFVFVSVCLSHAGTVSERLHRSAGYNTGV